MSAIKNLYTRRDELKTQIESMAGKKGVGQLRTELEGIKQRLSTLDARRRQMKANVNRQNAVGRSEGHADNRRREFDNLSVATIGRGDYDQLRFTAHYDYSQQRGYISTAWLERLAAQHPTHPNALRFAPWTQADRTLAAAIADGLIPAPDADFDKKGRGTAVNHDLYSYSHDGTLIVVQVRHATVTKYGTNVKIQYFVTDGDDAVELFKSKANVKKAAQADPSPDSPLRYLLPHLKKEWRAKIDDKPIKFSGPQSAEYPIYKILHDDEGMLRSVFNGEEYQIGKRKQQKALGDHKGGYYAFLDEATALALHRLGKAFNPEVVAGKKLVLAKGRAFGQPVVYSNGKRAFSRLVIDEIVGSVE